MEGAEHPDERFTPLVVEGSKAALARFNIDIHRPVVVETDFPHGQKPVHIFVLIGKFGQ
ncbi:hypothetical protein D3C87_1864690 [compost metagenome]